MAGESYTAVAKQAGVSVSTAWKWVRQDAAKPPVRRPHLSTAQRSEIESSIASCQYTLRGIAELHGCHISTVCEIRDAMPRAAYRPHAVAAVMAGSTYVAMARRSGVSLLAIWKWVREDVDNPPIRNPPIPKETKRKIQTAIDSRQLSLRQIAVQHGVHVSTVCAIRDTMAIGGHRAKPTRCPQCGGKSTTQDCLTCAALAYSRRSSFSVA